MAKVKHVTTASSFPLAADNYFSLSSYSATITTQANTQVTFNQGGVMNNLSINISANTTTACDFYIQQNGTNSAIVVSYTSGQTGLKQDITHSITVAVGDEINIFADITSGSSITLETITSIFDSSAYTYRLFIMNDDSVAQNDALTRFIPFDYSALGTTEAQNQCEIMTTGTMTHLFINVITNTHTTANSVFSLSVNASTTGCPTVTYAFAQTGFKEDTSTVKTIADGDLCCFKCVTDANTGTTTITSTTYSIGFYTTTGKFQNSSLSVGQAIANNVTTYYAIGGSLTATNTTESKREVSHYSGDNNITEFLVEVSANTNTAATSATFTLRINRADTLLILTYGASVTGTKSIVSSARVINGDEVDYKAVTGVDATKTVTIQQISSLYELMPEFYPTNRINFNDIDEGEEIG